MPHADHSLVQARGAAHLALVVVRHRVRAAEARAVTGNGTPFWTHTGRLTTRWIQPTFRPIPTQRVPTGVI